MKHLASHGILILILKEATKFEISGRSKKHFHGNKRYEIYCETSSVTWNIYAHLPSQQSYEIGVG